MSFSHPLFKTTGDPSKYKYYLYSNRQCFIKNAPLEKDLYLFVVIQPTANLKQT